MGICAIWDMGYEVRCEVSSMGYGVWAMGMGDYGVSISIGAKMGIYDRASAQTTSRSSAKGATCFAWFHISTFRGTCLCSQNTRPLHGAAAAGGPGWGTAIG